jgi:hypothetical protein
MRCARQQTQTTPLEVRLRTERPLEGRSSKLALKNPDNSVSAGGGYVNTPNPIGLIAFNIAKPVSEYVQDLGQELRRHRDYR